MDNKKENLGVKSIKTITNYYEKMYKELQEKNDPNEEEKRKAIKEELDKYKDILSKINVKEETQDIEEKVENQENKIEIKADEKKENKEDKVIKKAETVKQEPKKPVKKIEKKEDKLDNITVILDCERGEYLIKSNSSIDFRGYEIRTKLLNNKRDRKEYLEHLHNIYGEFEDKEIDLTLCKAIEECYNEEKSKEITEKFIKAVGAFNKELLPFKLAYNFNGLKELRKEGFLTKSGANRLQDIADLYFENYLADVQKEERGFKKVISSFKRFFSKREFRGNIGLLEEGKENQRIIKIAFKDGTYSLECGKSKGKKYGDIYMFDAKAILEDEKEVENIEKDYGILLSKKDISRIDFSIYKLLKYFEKINKRVEDFDLNDLAKEYIEAIINKKISFDIDNSLDIKYNLGCLKTVEVELFSDKEINMLIKKAKFAEKIGLASVSNDDEYVEVSDELFKRLTSDNYFCKITDESDLDDKNKKGLKILREKIKEKEEKDKDTDNILKQLAEEKNIKLKINNIKKTMEQLKFEIVEKIIKENN